MSVISAYEKMIKEGKLNHRTVIAQPTPDNPDGSTFSVPRNTNDNEIQDEQYNEQLKARLLERAKAKGKLDDNMVEEIKNKPIVKKEKNININKLEERVKELEETVMILMKQQMKMIQEKEESKK